MSPFVIGGTGGESVRDLFIGRLGLPTVEDSMGEQLGSDVQAVGDSTAVGMRRVKGFTMSFPVHGGLGDPDPYLAGDIMRRQLRSIMQNAPYRLAGLYVYFAFDTERNGWMTLGTATLNDQPGASTLAEYILNIEQAYRTAALNTERDAFRVGLLDLRLSTSPVDYLGQVINSATRFAGMNIVPMVGIPQGAYDISAYDSPVTGASRSSADGQVSVVNTKTAQGYGFSSSALADGDVVSWERAESSFNLGDVVAWDRRGNYGPFGSGQFDVAPYPGTDSVQSTYNWEEMYGPDYPYSWIESGAIDTPVIANGLCRVRYDPTENYDCFAVDAWNPSTNAYAEQGVMAVSGVNPDTTILSSSIVEYTPERVVIRAVMTDATGTQRERVYITLQRGWLGPRFEVYSNSGTTTQLVFQLSSGDSNDGAMANAGLSATSGASYLSSAAGSSTSPWVSGTAMTTSGYITSGENWGSVIRAGAAFQLNWATAVNLQPVATQASVYPTTGNAVTWRCPANSGISGVPNDYCSVRLSFTPLLAGQAQDAETIRNSGSSTTSQVSDPTASGGAAVQDTQAAATNATLSGATSLESGASYRLFARVKVVTSGATVSVKWALGTVSGSTATSTATAWTWLDLGEVTAAVANPTLTVTEWRSAGSGNVEIDRTELVCTSEPVGLSGGRDLGQAMLASVVVETRKVKRA